MEGVPVLNWIGKDAVVNHDKKVPFRLLKKNKTKSIGDSENLIIEGDNLEALKALLPHYQNKIKCVYIDPPYNTGNEKWIYNDNVNSPKIKKWLGKTIGNVNEDLTRHDKWLCMMYPRLKLLEKLLSEDGVIFISIDDNEAHNLRLIMDEIFNSKNFITQLVWKKKYTGGKHANHFVDFHEYIFVYGKNKKNIKKFTIDRTEKEKEKFINKDKNFVKWGKYYDRPFKSNLDERKTLVYPIKLPNGNVITNQWIVSKEKFEEWVKIDKVFFKKLKNKKYDVYIKYYENENGGKVMAPSIIDDNIDENMKINECHRKNISQIIEEIQKKKPTKKELDVIIRLMLSHSSVIDGVYNNDATNELRNIFGLTQTRDAKKLFANPKPIKLIKKLIDMSTNTNDVILDSFAGSGTTGHAVLELNKENNDNKKFILIELDRNICKKVTSQRIKKAIKGFFNVPGIGGGFQYTVLGKKLFDSSGKIDDTCTFEDLASYVYFTETKTILEPKKINNALLGSYNNTKYYLIFNKRGKNSLDRKFLASLDRNDDKVIYADKCNLDDSTLKKYNTIFKQIPYEIREF